jgi:5-methylthioribose kinase
LGTQKALTDAAVPAYLRRVGLVRAEERVEVTPAGDGNINWVRRATIVGPSRRSYVLKQARPRLERFPEYEAPTDRLLFEARWLELAAAHDTAGFCPRVHHLDGEQRVLVLEDLGRAERLDAALARGADVAKPLERLARFLGRVHAATAGAVAAESFANAGMQGLHGDHIFVLPFAENDFPLTPALRSRAEALKADRDLLARAHALHQRFLTPEGSLVHGDVQAGNILLAENRVTLLDAEIAHVGDPAFDLGSLLAHAVLPAVARGEAEAARPFLRAVLRGYEEGRGSTAAAQEHTRALGFGGLELLRRTVGAARVEAVAKDEASLRVIATGRAWVGAEAGTTPETTPL